MTESPADFDLDSGVSKQSSIESTPASAASRKGTLRMFRPRFSVRTFILLTTFATIGLGLFLQLERPRQVRMVGHLLTLTNWEVLYLNDNQLNDVAIAELHRLTKLKCRHLENAGVSLSAIPTLKEVLPNCLILGP